MKRLLSLLLVVLPTMLLTGCGRFVTSGQYTLESGDTLNGNLVLTSGQAWLKENSHVEGSVYVTSGQLDADGDIEGNLVVTSGSVNLGPHSVVRGSITVTSGSVHRADGSRVEGQQALTESTGLSIEGIGRFIAWLFFLLATPLVLLLSRGLLEKNPPMLPARPAPEEPVRTNSSVLIGGLLVVLGVLFLAAQVLSLAIWHFAWPLVIIIPGLLFFVGMELGGRNAARLAIPGSLVTITGLILLYQNTFDHFQSWAYAWALIFPTSIGVGQYIEGIWAGDVNRQQNGLRLANAGLIIFVVGGIFFELVLNVSGLLNNTLARFAWPLLLIGVGVYLLLFRRRPSFGREIPPQSGAGHLVPSSSVTVSKRGQDVR